LFYHACWILVTREVSCVPNLEHLVHLFAHCVHIFLFDISSKVWHIFRFSHPKWGKLEWSLYIMWEKCVGLSFMYSWFSIYSKTISSLTQPTIWEPVFHSFQSMLTFSQLIHHTRRYWWLVFLLILCLKYIPFTLGWYLKHF
jgi:hypothetical protein